MSQTHIGTVAIIGRPNAGKSTLINALLDAEASIVTAKPHTTRQAIRAVLTRPEQQIVFVDTPGIHTDAKRLLNRSMNKNISMSQDMADAILWVVEPHRWGKEETWLLESLPKDRPVILVINKIDTLDDQDDLLTIAKTLKEHHSFFAIHAISAKKGHHLKDLLKTIDQTLYPGDFMFAVDQVHLESDETRLSECIRIPLMVRLKQELPYQTKVTIDKKVMKKKVMHLHATIWVERPGQKSIIIGKGGQTIKSIGIDARKAIEKMVKGRVVLKLWVRVEKDWSDDPNHVA